MEFDKKELLLLWLTLSIRIENTMKNQLSVSQEIADLTNKITSELIK